MNLPRHPDSLEFNVMECCAMCRAIVNFMHGYLSQMGDARPFHIASDLLRHFQHNTAPVILPLNITECTFCSLFVSAERTVLEENQDAMLSCGHSARQHCKAMDSISIKLMLPPQA